MVLEELNKVDSYLPSTYESHDCFGEYIEAGKTVAEELGFDTVYLFREELVRPPENTLICEGEKGYLVFEEDYPFQRADFQYVKDLDPVLPESLRFRNKHLKNTGDDDELLRAEALELGEVVFEDHITSSFDAVNNVVLAALKDFQNFS